MGKLNGSGDYEIKGGYVSLLDGTGGTIYKALQGLIALSDELKKKISNK
jgi:hypothetical protein